MMFCGKQELSAGRWDGLWLAIISTQPLRFCQSVAQHQKTQKIAKNIMPRCQHWASPCIEALNWTVIFLKSLDINLNEQQTVTKPLKCRVQKHSLLDVTEMAIEIHKPVMPAFCMISQKLLCYWCYISTQAAFWQLCPCFVALLYMQLHISRCQWGRLINLIAAFFPCCVYAQHLQDLVTQVSILQQKEFYAWSGMRMKHSDFSSCSNAISFFHWNTAISEAPRQSPFNSKILP